MSVAINGGQPGVGRAAEVAAVVHVQAKPRQGWCDVGYAQRLGAHARATATRADVCGGADQANAVVHGVNAFVV